MHRIITICLLIWCAAPQAQQTDWETIIVKGNRQAQTITELSSNIAVLTSQDINQQRAIHINELLSQVAGSWISRGNGQESLIAIRSPVLTGAGSCGAFLIAEDGIPIRPAGFCNANQLFEINSEQAGQIEVIRGPGSSIYGSNAVHGVINILSPDILNQSPINIGLETGPDQYQRGKFSLSRHDNHQGWMAYGNVSKDAGYQQDAGYEQQKLNLLHQLQHDDFSAKTVLTGTHINQHSAGFIQGKDSYKNEEVRRSNPNPDAFRHASSTRLSSHLTWVTEHERTFSLTPYFRHSDMTFSQHWLPWQPVEHNQQQSAGLQSQYEVNWQSLKLRSGLDIEWSDSELTETQTQPFSAAIPPGQHYNYQVTSRLISPWLQLDWQLGSATRLTGGLRFDDTRYDYRNRLDVGSACGADIAECRFYRPPDTQLSYQNWSPRLGLVHQWRANQYVYTNLSSGFRAPQTTELFRLQAGQQSADLDAEQLTSLEAGLRGGGSGFSYDLSLFMMRKKHFIFQDTERHNISNGKTRHKGLELTASYRFTESLLLQGSATFARHQYANSIRISSEDINGNDIDTAPKVMGQLALNWQPDTDYRAQLQWQYLGRYYLDPENSATYPGHSLLHLNTSYPLSNSIDLSINIRNLTNKNYAERADIAFGNYRYFVGLPRSIYLGINWQM
ncbi:TonB-dependent receptor [Neptunicella sp. SCSIO 80796]|uniref:TonB-dependent receptor n=1 Tax=Neptunicella plasticusilytica TaxID=3117012 RepID=UPI003A4D3436